MKLFVLMFVFYSAALESIAIAQQETNRSENADSKRDDVAIELNNLAARFDLKFVTEVSDIPADTMLRGISFKTADGKANESYAKLFINEFQIYPPEFVKRTRLKRVVFCTELAWAGQRRNAIPDTRHNTLYLEVIRGRGNARYMRRVIHHEFFHIVDKRDDGRLYRDKHWAALNPPDFEYGDGGSSAQNNSETGVWTDKYPGFINHYSTTGVEEDKAEIFSYMVTDIDRLQERGKSDDVLKSKVGFMRKLLTRFCADLDEEFWKKSKAIDRSAKQ